MSKRKTPAKIKVSDRQDVGIGGESHQRAGGGHPPMTTNQGGLGFFELTDSLAEFTRAKVLSEVGVRTPLFTRFSTVAGNMGSADTARDVRGCAVKFYTQEVTGTSSATTCRCSSSRTRSGFPT